MKRTLIFSLALLLILGTIIFPKNLQSEEKIMQKWIETLEVGEEVYYENLTLIPIYTQKIKDHTHYTTLDEAFKNNWLEIKEVDGGRVPQVRVSNLSGKIIYLMGGEVLTGCKQDRIVGRDVLIRPYQKNILIPVYCVEQGRWHYQSNGFTTKKNLGTYKLRREAQGAKGEAQSKIWDRIAESSTDLEVASPTTNYQDIYEKKEVRDRIEVYEKKMEKVPDLYDDTIGILVGVGGRIVSADIFVNPSLFKNLWPKLLKSSALSALNSDRPGVVTQEEAADFFRKLLEKKYQKRKAIDLGEEYSFINHKMNVNGLVYRKGVIHLAVFTEEEKGSSWKKEDTERRIPVLRR